MRRLMAICPTPNDATSFYRGIGPIARLIKDVPDLNAVFVTHVDYSTLAPCDAVFMQRPYRPNDLAAAMMVKRHRRPLWLDYDDDLFTVQQDNPTHQVYAEKSTQERVAKLLGMADVITVSTEHLRERYAPLAKNIVVVPNAIDDFDFEARRPRPEKRDKVVLWRGGSTHQRDLMGVAQALVDASHDPRLSDWMFHFQGYNPWWITEQMRKSHTRWAAGIETSEYMALLEELAPPLMIVPLEDNVFNRSKSSCSWIEGAYAGAAVIAPLLPEFLRPGIVNYRSQSEFATLLRRAMLGELNVRALAEAGWEEVKRKYTLSVVNQIRKRVIDELTVRPRGFR